MSLNNSYDISQKRTPNPSLRELKNQYDSLYKEHNKLTTRFHNTKSLLKTANSSVCSLKQQLSSSKGTVTKLQSQNKQLEKLNQEHKTYIRKLEGAIAIGSTGHQLADLNSNLHSQLKSLKNEKTELTEQVSHLQEKVTFLQEENQILDTALKSRAGEEGASLLEETASAQHKVQELQTQLNQAYTKIEELKFIRENNNEELNRLETLNFKLSKENEELRSQNKELAKSRGGLLQYVEEMTAQLKQYEEDMDTFDQEITTRKTYQKELDELKAKTQSQEKELTQLQETNSSQTLKIQTLETQNQTLNKQVSELKDQLSLKTQNEQVTFK